MVTLILSDGTEINNLDINGNNIISDSKLEGLTEDKLTTLTIKETDKPDIVMHNARLHQQVQYADGKWYSVFVERTAREMLDMNLNAQIQYLAMMTGVEL